MNRASLARLAVGGVVLLSLSGLLYAQGTERILYVTALDESSRAPVTGLGPDAFNVREDGVRREVLRVAPATTPMPVAVIVDNSQPASATIADLRRSLTSFIGAMAGIGPMAIIGVADRPTILADYTDSQKTLLDAAHRLYAVPGSGARLLDAIIETARGLRRQEADRAAIVVVTTENVEFSDVHFTQVLEALEESGAQMHVITLINPQGSMDTDAARNRASVLDRGPRESGGVRFDVLASMAYEGRLQELAALLKSQYRLVYSRPESLIPPERLDISSPRPGLDVHGAPARGQAPR